MMVGVCDLVTPRFRKTFNSYFLIPTFVTSAVGCSDKSELGYARGIDLLLVMEGNGFQCQERFTGFIHRVDVILKRGG